MDFVANTETQLIAMLASIGVQQVEELFSDIEKSLLIPRPTVDDGLSEYEGLKLMEVLAAKNSYSSFDNYLGAGAYEHHVPALVGALCARSEFLTSYTPYQAEASQGMLQATFEFQSTICALTGMDVANASVYDGASACGEAVLMALRIHPERNTIVISDNLHPHYRKVVELYISKQNIEIKQGAPDDKTAVVLIQSPNFYGVIEDVKAIAAQAHEAGALCILCANPLAYGIMPSAAEYGADIAVGDCQPFGHHLLFGGPYVGYMACKQPFLRQLPGRIIGETKDAQGRRGFVLTLQAREQHIRREKATSNICTNQALAALASLITLLWYGPQGIKALALTNFQRAAYLKDHLCRIPGISSVHSGEHFNEFAVRFNRPLEKVMSHFRQAGIEPGLPLKDQLLIAVTETKSKEQLDRYLEVARGIR